MERPILFTYFHLLEIATQNYTLLNFWQKLSIFYFRFRASFSGSLSMFLVFICYPENLIKMII